MRGSVSHIDAKKRKGYWTVVISVLCRLYKLGLNYQNQSSFVQHYWSNNIFIWSSVYLQLLQYFILFLLLLQWWTTRSKKKKKKMLYNFQEMQLHAFLYNSAIQSEYIQSSNAIDVYMYAYGWIKFNGHRSVSGSSLLKRTPALNKKTFITAKTSHKF